MKNLYVTISLIVISANLTFSQGFKWGVSAGSTGNDHGRGVAIDEQGSYYSFGLFSGTLSLDSMGNNKNISSAGGYDMVLIKYNCLREYQWALPIGGISDEWGGYAEGDIATDASSNIYVTGKFWGTCKFNTRSGNAVSLSSTGFSDAFIAKYNKDGGLQWVQQIGSTAREQGIKVHATAAGDVYGTGDFGGNTNFSGSTGGQNLTAVSPHDIYLVKYNTNGELQWVSSAGGTGEAVGHGVSVDKDGNAFVTGLLPWAGGSVTFGTHTVTNSSGWGMFIAKCSPSGTWMWANKAGESGSEGGSEVRVDRQGNVYVTGGFENSTSFTSTTGGPINVNSNGSHDYYLAKYTNQGGLAWVRTGGGTGIDAGVGLEIDNFDNPCVGGYFNGSATFGSGSNTVVLNSAGSSDMFVAKYDGSGTFQWARRAGGSGLDDIYDMAVKKSGDLLVVGHLNTSASIGSSNITPKGQQDFLIAEIRNDRSFGIKGPSGICPGQTARLDAGMTNGAPHAWLLNDTVVHNSTDPFYDAVKPGTYKVIVSPCDIPDTSEIFILGTSLKPSALTISGPANSSPNSQETYSVSPTGGSIYSWGINGGSQVGGATNSILVQWGTVSTGELTAVETNASGCHSDTAKKTVTLTAGTLVEQIPVEGRIDFILYPVPTSDLLNFRFGGQQKEYTITIMNTMGQEMLNKTLDETGYEVNISHLSKGIYFVVVSDGIHYSTKYFEKL
jgi:hypothetical protein